MSVKANRNGGCLPKGDIIIASPARTDDDSPHAECWSVGEVGAQSPGISNSSGNSRAVSFEESGRNREMMPNQQEGMSSDGDGRPSNESSNQVSGLTSENSLDQRGVPHAPTISTLSSLSVVSRQRRLTQNQLARHHALFMRSGRYNRYNDVDDLLQGRPIPFPVDEEAVGEPDEIETPANDEVAEEKHNRPKRSFLLDRRVLAVLLCLVASAIALAVYFIVARITGRASGNHNFVGPGEPKEDWPGEAESTGGSLLFVFMDPFSVKLATDPPDRVSEDLLSTVVQSWLGGFLASISYFHSLELDATATPLARRHLADGRYLQERTSLLDVQFDGIVKMKADLTKNVDLSTIQALIQAVLRRAFSVPNIDLFLQEMKRNGLEVQGLAVFDSSGNEIGSSGSLNLTYESESDGATSSPTQYPETESNGTYSAKPAEELSKSTTEPTTEATEEPEFLPAPTDPPAETPGSTPFIYPTQPPSRKPSPSNIFLFTHKPTAKPYRTDEPTPKPKTYSPHNPTIKPTPEPTLRFSPEPTYSPISRPKPETTPIPSQVPTISITQINQSEPTPKPSKGPTSNPTDSPTYEFLTYELTAIPTEMPILESSSSPKSNPTPIPSPMLSPQPAEPPPTVPSRSIEDEVTGYAATPKEQRSQTLLVSVSGDKIFESGTAQKESYEWLVFEDDFPLGNVDDDELKERYTVALLYISLGGKGWRDDGEFLGSSSVCDWFGVECDRDGRVVELDWNSNDLSGTIPEEIGFLPKLKILRLHTKSEYLEDRPNSIGDSIPSSIGSLQELEELRLSNCGLRGTLPSFIGEMLSLKHLLLQENQFVGSIPRSLGHLGNLEYLNLSRNPIDGDLPQNLGQLHNLEDFRIGNTNIGGTIPTEIGRLKYLTFINLQKNLLTGSIPTELGRLGNLKTLWLDDNELAGSIPSELGSLELLEDLFLDRNMLTGTVPTSLERLFEIERLRLHKNKLWGSVPDAFCACLLELSADCDTNEPMIACPCCTCCGENCYEER